MHQVSCWRPEPVKWKVRRRRGGSGGQKSRLRGGQASEALCRPTLRPSSVPPSGQGLAGLHGWLASGGPLEGYWCYVCRDLFWSLPYKHSTRGPPEDSHPMEASHLIHRDGLQGGPPEGLLRLATSELTLLSHDPPLWLLIFLFTCFGLQQPTKCLHSAYSSDMELASSLVPLAR